MTTQYQPEPWTLAELDVLTRWYRLRKLGYCRPLLQDGRRLWVFDAVDAEATRQRVGIEDVREMVEAAEALLRIGYKRCESERTLAAKLAASA